MKALQIFLISVLGFGCSAGTEVPLFYFEDRGLRESQVETTEGLIKSIANQRGFRIFEHDRWASKKASGGHEAFFIALYIEDHYILSITNSGVSTVLRMSVYDTPSLSGEALETLIEDIRMALLYKANVELLEVSQP